MKDIAKDGKPYDIEDGLTLKENEVEVIQYLVPSGKRRRMAALVGEDYVKKAENLILSVEIVNPDEVVLYARRINEPKEKDKVMIATNDQGVNNTIPVVKKLIDVFLQ